MDRFTFFIDIDGTLANDEKQVPEENLKAIKEARARGHMVFINTGRSVSRLPDQISFDTGVDGVITSLGATIFHGRNVIFENYTTVDETIEIYNICKKCGWHFYFDTEFQKYELNVPENNTHVPISEMKTQKDRLLAFSKDDAIITGEDYIRENNIRLSKMIAFPEKDGKDEFMKLSKFFTIHSTLGYYDLSLKANGKDKGIKWVCEHFGLDLSKTVAMGDSENDNPMLNFAAFSAVPKNATEGAKKTAKYISPLTNNEGFVAEVIRKFI